MKKYSKSFRGRRPWKKKIDSNCKNIIKDGTYTKLNKPLSIKSRLINP
jgi:hypothetical protein